MSSDFKPETLLRSGVSHVQVTPEGFLESLLQLGWLVHHTPENAVLTLGRLSYRASQGG